MHTLEDKPQNNDILLLYIIIGIDIVLICSFGSAKSLCNSVLFLDFFYSNCRPNHSKITMIYIVIIIYKFECVFLHCMLLACCIDLL